MPVSHECRYPNGNVLYRRLRKTFPRIVRAEGSTLYDSEGKTYLDACGGAYVANIGHGVREVADALSEQARRLAYVNGTAFTSDAAEEAAKELAKFCPHGLDKVFFLLSGSDAVEAALKTARQYWSELGKPEKKLIIALEPSYHGSTLLALSASGRPAYRRALGDWAVDVAFIPAPYAYRCDCGGSPACRACGGGALADKIKQLGAENVAAFLAEPIGGSSTGCAVPSQEWMRNIRSACKDNDVLFIADEVLTGAGRTGAWSALEHYGVVPDMQVFGKGITGGYAPLSALVVSEKIADVFARGPGGLPHNQTFSHFPVSCAAAAAAMACIRERRLIERSAKMGEFLHARLSKLLAHPNVGDVRGRGMLAGVEFVEDKATKKPFPRSAKFVETFVETAQAAGLVLWPNYGHTRDEDGDLAMLAPPFTATEAELAKMADLFETALKGALETLKSGRGA